jgi:hypothetical protein
METRIKYTAASQTDEDTIRTREALANIPLSQKLLRAGYKPITKNQLRERFCCGQLTGKAREKAIKHLLTKRGGTTKNIDCPYDGYVRYSRFFTEDYSRYSVYDIDITPYDFYVGDVLPDRCLRSIKTAQGFGVKDFGIVTCVEKKDPIIVGFMGNTYPECINQPMFEIDFWE